MIKILESLRDKLRLVVGRCVIIASRYGDDGLNVDVELTPREKRRNVEFLQQYGFISRPKGAVSAVALFPDGNRSNGLVIACDGDGEGVSKNLEEGEVCMISPYGQQIYFQKDGSISIVSGNGVVNLDGELNVTKGVNSGGNVVAFNNSPNKVTLANHVHVTPSGNSSPPTPGS